MTGKAKKDVRVFRVMRSFDAFNEGELYATHEDDFTKSRVSAGLFREVTQAEVDALEQRGALVLKTSDDIFTEPPVPATEGAPSAPKVEGSNAAQP
jgi:hypothetical protein